ncbi:MurR/RpiR family transcriptional regulator [Fictibacillus enclensis]|uniref:MurR/RpiR family transcriptional regulator n=1 Tax=Fictibacillus enclensis TaxID=1017270 RepID=UPI0024C003BF|nr:MurR/RpiR family transcriptional regulator [Fictibacillus enclensis]WHY71228.1 MurR/RpiR family transcriptional regulator [Fictibacillus enclensis]
MKRLLLNKILATIGDTINDTEYMVLLDLIEHMDQLQTYSIREAAKNNYVSTSSISRLSVKMGLSGYSELKFFLKQQYDYLEDNQNDTDSSINKMASVLLNSFQQNYKNTITQLNEEDLEHFIQLLSHSSYIGVCGSGISEIVATYFTQRFQIIGKDTWLVNVSAPGGIYMNQLAKSQLMVVFSRSGESSYTLSKAQIAKREGIKIAAITSSRNSTLAEMADLILPIYGSGEPLDVSYNITSYNSIAVLFIDLLLQLYMDSVPSDSLEEKK